MKVIIILMGIICTLNVFSQDKSFRRTYDYDGYILSNTGDTFQIRMNYLVLLDSTILGSYYYKSPNSSLKLSGHLNIDNSFALVERDNTEVITGFFNGRIAKDRKSANGYWTSPDKKQKLVFQLVESSRKSYGYYIAKNRIYRPKSGNKRKR
jgi:hypothetical protein